MILLIVFFDIYSRNSSPLGVFGKDAYKSSQTAQLEPLVKADELLHARLWQLQNMDQQYSSVFTSQNDGERLVSLNKEILYAEQRFKRTIDSIESLGKKFDKDAATNNFQNLTGFFRSVLDNRRFLAYARLHLTSDNKGAANYITLLNLQEELQKKDKLLAVRADSNSINKERTGFQNTIAQKDKEIQDLQIRIEKAEAEKQTYTQTVQQLQTELNEKNKLIGASANQKLASEQKRSLDMQKEITQKNDQIRNLQTALQKEQSEKKTYAQSVGNLQTQLREKDKLIAASENKKVGADQKRVLDMQKEITQKNDQIRNLQAVLQKEQSEKKTYAQSVSNLQTQLSEKNKLLAASENRKLGSDQKKLLDMQKEVTQKNDQIRNLQAVLQKEQSEKKSYAQSVSNLQAELNEKNKLVIAANSRKPASDQNALVTLQNQLVAKDKRIRSLEDQLKRDPANSQANKPVQTQLVKDLQQRNSNLKVAYDNSLAQINLLTRKYNVLKSEYDILRNQR